MNEAKKRLRRCCFTDHRPEKLSRQERETKSALTKEIRQAIADGFTVFITGMGRGVDLWAVQPAAGKNSTAIAFLLFAPIRWLQNG